jgi:uncharacterized protein YndB with AHSA1/START domain
MSKQRSVTHATFTIERIYDAAPERVFKAFADPKAKAQWFGGPEGWTSSGLESDFRVGGHERESGGPQGGPVHTYEATYHDIVENERLVFTYDMYLDDERISVSLASVELKPAGEQTTLIYTEAGAYLDGFDIPDQREQGTRDLLDNLDVALRKEVV